MGILGVVFFNICWYFEVLLGGAAVWELDIITYMHTCMHGYMHTFIHAYMHTYIQNI